MKSQWETISDQLQRARVPGGWLYRTWIGQDTPGSPAHGVTMVFVPAGPADK